MIVIRCDRCNAIAYKKKNDAMPLQGDLVSSNDFLTGDGQVIVVGSVPKCWHCGAELIFTMRPKEVSLGILERTI